MTSWSVKRIDDFGRIITGKTPSGEKPDEFGDKYPFITPSDIPQTQRQVATARCLSDKGYETHKRMLLPNKSICVVCIGATIGKVCMTDRLSFSNQQINSIIPAKGKNDPYFIYYLSTTLKSALINFAGGAATPIVNKSVFSGIKMLAPDFKEQQKIAAVLSTYDDMIENNRRRIVLLEKMAEEIYREWFVRMRFPGHEKVKVVKGVPEGWEVKKLGSVLEFCYGKALKEGERVPGHFPVFGSSGVVGTHKKALVSGPGIIVGRKGNVGSVHWSDVGFFPIDTVYYVKSDLSLHYLFFLLQSMNFINNDAAVPGLNRSQAYSNLFYLPTGPLIQKFAETAKQLFDLRDNYNCQNTKLIVTRDMLLPRLISGKLSVEDLDINCPQSTIS